jgi:hypothetical protein
MPRCPIVCVWPDGENFRVTRQEADVIVADDLGDWDGRNTVRMKPINRTGGRLSLRVGARLAVAVQRNESWARTMLEQIERC